MDCISRKGSLSQQSTATTSAPAFRQFETEEAIPGADIEDTLSGQVCGDRKLRQPFSQSLKTTNAFDHRPVRHFERVPPSEFAKLAVPILDVAETPSSLIQANVARDPNRRL
jgi:hypothetical protein